MFKKVDARGLSCPQPVILAKRAMDQFPDEGVQVWVDTGVARDNVERLARMRGFTVKVRTEGNAFILDIGNEQ